MSIGSRGPSKPGAGAEQKQEQGQGARTGGGGGGEAQEYPVALSGRCSLKDLRCQRPPQMSPFPFVIKIPLCGGDEFQRLFNLSGTWDW